MLCYMICYLASFLFARASVYFLSGLALLFAAGVLFYKEMKGPGLPVRLRALFSLSFVGGQGLSCMKLSYLQTDWEPLTWAVLFLAYAVFWLVFELMKRNQGTQAGRTGGKMLPFRPDRLFLAILGICGISWISFLTEAAVLGYVPLFLRGVPHAYSWFHISGLHYFTVSCALIPALAVVWFETEHGASDLQKTAVLVCCVCAFLIPILCVSRSQMLLAAMLAGFTLAVMERGNVPPWMAGAVGIVLVILYALLTVARSHSVEYLNSIFEMKLRLPIFISQPYIYISNNYDNLNCLIRDLTQHTLGVRSLFPVWALTGLKFFFPALVGSPLYLTKEELTTLTLFYDAYYDFGTIGVVLFSAVLGAAAFRLEARMQEAHDPLLTVFFAQMAVYLSLAFFTTWFSNPATWFYLAETLAVYLFCRKYR